MFKRIYLALLILALAACGDSKKDPITIGYSDWPGWVAWEIAIEKGMFEKKGVDVEFVWFDNYVDSLQAMDAQQLSGNCQTWNDTIFSLAGTGLSMKAVLVNDNSNGNDGVVAMGVDSMEGLKGKPVAAEEGTVSHFVLLTALSKYGMTQADVDFKNILVQDAGNALALGNISAAAVWQPSLFNALQEPGSKLLFSSKEMPGLIPDMLVFHDDVVKSRPEDIQKIVEVWFEVLQFIEENPDEAFEIMAKKVGQKPEDYKVFIDGTKFFSLEDNINAFEKRDDDSSLFGSGKTISDFYLGVPALGIEEAPDYASALDAQFVEKLK